MKRLAIFVECERKEDGPDEGRKDEAVPENISSRQRPRQKAANNDDA
jgi:hypothetical protein